MLQNYITLAVRNLLKHKTFSLLNIAGWAIGMAVCIAMLLFVRHEKSFDRFHTKADRIYRLTEVQRFEGTGEQLVPLSMWPMAEMLERDYPEIETTVRLYQMGEAVLKHAGKQAAIEELCQVDSTFFRIFDFAFAEGDVRSALQNANGMVLTATTARNMFGSAENAVGKTIELNRGTKFEPFTVTAVLADLPETSHLQFDALIPMHELAGKMQFWMEGWDSNWLVTYLLFRENTSPEKVAADLPNYEKRYMETQQHNYDLGFQALADVHLGSANITHDDLNYKKFDGRYVGIFSWLALFVLLIACFNFINLTTARAVNRVREVGVRKAIGASRWQLIGQFTGEAVLTALCALAAAAVLVVAGLPLLGKVIDRPLALPLWSQPGLLALLIGAAVLTGMVSGLYPAVAATWYKPTEALKGNVTTKKGGISLRSGLVVAQFSIAIALIIATFLAVGQLNFIRNKNLGFDKSQVLQIPMNATANQHYETLRNELMKNPDILGITAAGRRLGGIIGQMGARVKINGEERKLSLAQMMVDYNYFDFYGIQLRDGRSFSRDFAQDMGHSFIVNEAFAREAGTENLVGQPLRGGWQKEWGSIVGVVKDFNFNSLHHKVAPMCISIQEWDFSEMSVKIDPQHTAEALRALELEWAKQVPDLPFRYTFLDDHFAKLYKTDTQVSRVVGISSFLAIVIACMGLFGLAMFVVQTRTKEIGIRKVLGASVAGITGLLTKDFLKLIIVAIAIAAPVAYFFMQKWLADFAYRIDVQWWVFLMAGAVAVAVAFLTVGFQSIRAALANPVKSLRSE